MLYGLQCKILPYATSFMFSNEIAKRRKFGKGKTQNDLVVHQKFSKRFHGPLIRAPKIP